MGRSDTYRFELVAQPGWSKRAARYDVGLEAHTHKRPAHTSTSPSGSPSPAPHSLPSSAVPDNSNSTPYRHTRYDAGNRVSRILDGANARARYHYVGGRISEKTLFNGGTTVSTLKVLYDGAGMITSHLYRNAANDATIIGYEHAYDKLGNPNYEVRTHQSSHGEEYTYDNLYRATRVVYDDTTPTTPTSAPSASSADDFMVDTIGNRTKIYAKSATPTEYLHNPVNEYTSVGGTAHEYDAAGNLTKDATHNFYWDYENRLTKVTLVADSSDVGEYTYDALRRRVEKIDKAADPDVTTRFIYDAWSVIEERDGGGTLQATYINGASIDEPILMNRDSTDYWYMQSPLQGNVAALVDSNGAIQEGYKYRAHGTVTVLTSDGNDDTWFTADDDTATTSAIGNPYTYTARRLDSETMLMYFRLRPYNPVLGIFISRDPIGYHDGMSLYLGYFVPYGVDPFGLEWKKSGRSWRMDSAGVCSDGESGDTLAKLARSLSKYSARRGCAERRS